MTVTYPDLTEPASSSIPLSELDNAIAAAIAYLRSNNYDPDGPASPVMGEFRVRSTNDELGVYLGGWIPFRSFAAGKAVIWCDDGPEFIRLMCPDTGIVSGGYNIVLPPGAGSASQAMRIDSIDGNTIYLGWFTPTASSLALDGLTDVHTGTPVDGTTYALQWVAGSSRYELVEVTGGGSTSLGGLTDTDLDSPGAGEFLRHDGLSWINGPLVLGDIPSLSSLYAAASHSHPLSALTQSSAETGQFIRWNGSAWVAVDITAGDLPASYLPLTGGNLSGDTTFDAALIVSQDGSLVIEAADGRTTTILPPDSMVSSYSFKLPPESYATATEYNPPTGIGADGGLAVMAVNQLTGETLWIEVDGGGTGGRFILNGTDDPLGVAGEIRGANLTRPVIESFVAAGHTHDGSAGTAGMDGDGSPTLDMRYAADWSAGPLAPQAGGTGRTAIAAGALLLGGSSSVMVPEKVFMTENGGDLYTPMVQLLGDTDGAALVWDDTAGTWGQGPVPTAVTIDDPDAGDLVFWSGGLVHGSQLPAKIRFLDNLECGPLAGSTPGSVRLYQPPVIGTRSTTIISPSAPVDDLAITLPAQGGLVGDCLITTTAGDSMVLALGSPSRVDGVLFNLDGLSGGALLAYDGMEMIPFAAGLQSQVLTGGGAGSIGWSYPPGRTFTQSVSLGAVGPIESGTISRCVLVRAHVQLTITRVDVRVAGTSTPSITFQLAENGSGNVFSTPQAAPAGVTAYTSFADATIIAGSYLMLVISEVDGNVDDATVTVTFQQ